MINNSILEEIIKRIPKASDPPPKKKEEQKETKKTSK